MSKFFIMATDEEIRVCVDEEKFHSLTYKELEDHLEKLHEKYMRYKGYANEEMIRTVMKINKIKKYLNSRVTAYTPEGL